MRIHLHLQRFAYLCLCLFLFAACGDGQKKQEDDVAGDVKFSDAEQKLIKDISKVIADLPPPSIVPNTLMKLGTEYDPDLVNSIDKIEAYQTDEDKAALNLGVYATDVGYQVAYQQVEESLSHMGALQRLAETVGVSTAFDISLMENYEKSMNDSDALTKLLNETMLLAEKRLESSDRLGMAALVLSGSFVEGLYLVINIIEEYEGAGLSAQERNEKLQPLVNIILEQRQPLDDVIALMKDIPNHSGVTGMISELEILKLLYDNDLQEIEEAMGGDTNYVIPPDMLRDITSEVKRIREDIVS
ncbi:MAG: hypothetical protein R8G66_08165 [Cytophagales bacterium]|nr:hypothetical protein [Cytophagales bacterium]